MRAPTKSDFRRVDDIVWEIPPTFRGGMRVPARLYADETLLEQALTDKSVDQLLNTATLPGIVKYAIAMPDIVPLENLEMSERMGIILPS
jgi:tRNA-splicing ligase RtcB